MKSKLRTQLELPVEISFEILRPILVEGELLPLQVEILQVIVEVPDVNGKPRKVNVLSSLDEGTVMLLEDEVLEEHFQ